MHPMFLAASGADVLVLSTILGTAISVIVCGGIVFLAGSGQGKIGLAVLGTLVAVGVASFFAWWISLPTAIGLAILISMIPQFGKPLLSAAEVESETQKARYL
jgi:hypothetical protein